MAKEISRREMIAKVGTGALIAAAVSGEQPSTAAQGSTAAQEDLLFDVHQHVETTDANYSDFRSADEVIKKDYDIRIKIMDENGIGRSVMMASTQYRRTDGIQSTRRVNDLTAEYVSKHSDRFPVGVGTVEVTHGDASLRELERMSKDLKLRGVVWHHTHSGVQVNDPFMRPILRQVSVLGLIPFIHVGLKPYESLTKLEVLAEEFPQITFVALAAMAREEDAEQALEVAKRRKNVLFDTGPVIYARERGVEGFVKRIGSDRLLLGSDLYALRPSYRKASTTLEIIQNSQITSQDKAKILAGNVIKLFGLDPKSHV